MYWFGALVITIVAAYSSSGISGVVLFFILFFILYSIIKFFEKY
jgi:mannose/fructose/N-acetylgalactosamine-specific phosphotransferase system component IID